MFAAIVLPAGAAVSLNTQFGQAYNSDGTTTVADGTLWALVVAPGTSFAGFDINGSLKASNTTTPGIADTFFTSGQSLSLGGAVGTGTIFAMGAFNGTDSGLAGLYTGAVAVDYGTFGTAASRNFAFYWFPGATFTGVEANPQTIASQVGGLNNTSDDGVFNIGMVLPADGALLSTGAATTGDAGGSLSVSAFSAVTLIPEPSAALLGAIGALGLLRRRRN